MMKKGLCSTGWRGERAKTNGWERWLRLLRTRLCVLAVSPVTADLTAKIFHVVLCKQLADSLKRKPPPAFYPSILLVPHLWLGEPNLPSHRLAGGHVSHLDAGVKDKMLSVRCKVVPENLRCEIWEPRPKMEDRWREPLTNICNHQVKQK